MWPHLPGVVRLALVEATRRVLVGVGVASAYVVVGLVWLETTGLGALCVAAASAEPANAIAPPAAMITAAAPIAVAFALIFGPS